jgi:hypothetical protein
MPPVIEQLQLAENAFRDVQQAQLYMYASVGGGHHWGIPKHSDALKLTQSLRYSPSVGTMPALLAGRSSDIPSEISRQVQGMMPSTLKSI